MSDLSTLSHSILVPHTRIITQDGAVLFPFGFGLSYSSFDYTQHYEKSSLGVYNPCQFIKVRLCARARASVLPHTNPL